jgi:hypothetical protein
MDSAFLKRTGINNAMGLLLYNYLPNPKKVNWINMVTSFIFYEYVHDLNTGMDDTYLILSLEGHFSKSAYTGVHYFKTRESWMGQTFDLDQYYYFGHIQLTKWLHLDTILWWGDNIYYQGNPPFKGKWNDLSFGLDIQPSEKLSQSFSFSHTQLSKNSEKIYDVNLLFSRTTYQFNKYLFLRAMLQYNSYQKKLLTDLLASFTLVPGTVLHVGYGALYENREWQDGNWVRRQGDLLDIKRSFFTKISYLWRF